MILWTDVSNTLAELSNTVEQRDVNSLLSGNLQNEVVFRQLAEVGARADLLKYEVSVTFFCLNKSDCVFQIVFQFGGIYLDTDTVSVQPLRGRLRKSFVAYRLEPYYNIQSSIFGFPKVLQNLHKVTMHRLIPGFPLPAVCPRGG